MLCWCSCWKYIYQLLLLCNSETQMKRKYVIFFIYFIVQETVVFILNSKTFALIYLISSLMIIVPQNI